MAEFNIRTDAVDVEQIMRQIRARIQEKRGVDYTEQQIQELANVKLERFLDPKGVRSDLVEQFRRGQDRRPDPFQPQQYTVDANDLFGSSRTVIRLIRKLLNPILKLFLNAGRLVQVLHQQSEINALYEKQFHHLREENQRRDEIDALHYELVHNLVLELTRVSIENRNVKMRLESLSSRLDFDERRARALEGVVQYKAGSGPAREPQLAPAMPPSPAQTPQPNPLTPGADEQAGESSTARRRRRRRRGRRGGRGRIEGEGPLPAAAGPSGTTDTTVTPPHGDPTADAALDTDDSSGDDSPDAGGDDGDEGPEPSVQ
jgi:hypothetical protein